MPVAYSVRSAMNTQKASVGSTSSEDTTMRSMRHSSNAGFAVNQNGLTQMLHNLFTRFQDVRPATHGSLTAHTTTLQRTFAERTSILIDSGRRVATGHQ